MWFFYQNASWWHIWRFKVSWLVTCLRGYHMRLRTRDCGLSSDRQKLVVIRAPIQHLQHFPQEISLAVWKKWHLSVYFTFSCTSLLQYWVDRNFRYNFFETMRQHVSTCLWCVITDSHWQQETSPFLGNFFLLKRSELAVLK